MIKAFNTLTILAERIYGFKLSCYYIGTPDYLLTDRVLLEVLNTKFHAEVGLDFLTRLFKKTKRIFSHRWMYSSGLIPDKFWREFLLWTIKGHLLKPSQI